jgi:hypothetical protein
MKRRQVMLVAVLLLVAVAGLSGMAVSRPDKSGSSGEQWEYLVVAGGNVNLTPTDNPSMRKEPGAFAREDFPLESNLDKLGKNGWEMVTVTVGPTFIFKRRK